jgi:preprotein translocase subunit SecG
MQTVIIVVHLIIVLALIGVVLLQRSEGGLGLGGGGGVSGFMTGRGQANALTRATAVLAALFFLTSLVLTLFASYSRGPRSIFEGVAPTAPAGQQAPAGGAGPNVLEQLQRMQGEQPAAPSPAAPSIPLQGTGAPASGAPAPAPGAPQVPQSQ